ncbi:hypothetical protein JJB07_14960 [Tumebacillus sp. ITR2]|uniref:Phage holin n=1 Tax=Tumebacillus amylolyticus TaxID=2801339 RepID=A0ABS1JCD8_9BACL|nr:hypothetical protein [Tumebacillus amylolyticus]MBL0387939.1 hypothetical protein [Tumebacillus amylolyticus]
MTTNDLHTYIASVLGFATAVAPFAYWVVKTINHSKTNPDAQTAIHEAQAAVAPDITFTERWAHIQETVVHAIAYLKLEVGELPEELREQFVDYIEKKTGHRITIAELERVISTVTFAANEAKEHVDLQAIKALLDDLVQKEKTPA